MPTSSLEDSLARLFQLQENEQGSPWMTPAGHSLLKCLDSLATKGYRTYSLRMSKDSSITTEEEPSKSSLKSWMAWGMTVNGNCLTAKISASRNTENGYSLSEILEENPDPKYFLSDEQVTEIKRREGLFSNISPTLDAHYYKGGNSRPYVSVKAVVNPSLKVKNQNGRLIKEHDEPSFSLTAQDIHGVVLDDGKKISLRRLTPLECERLQGLPDGWTEFYHDGRRVSDSERYERCGRTITIPVVEAIGRRLHEFY